MCLSSQGKLKIVTKRIKRIKVTTKPHKIGKKLNSRDPLGLVKGVTKNV